jgi:monomeric isocitrate dehydrogenase
MRADELKEFYLAKMREAEELAAQTKDVDLKERWLSIADGYRILAHTRFPAHNR